MENPFASSPVEPVEPEPEVVRHPVVATVGGVLLGVAGLFSAAAGAQVMSLVVVTSWWAWVVPPVLVALGVAAVVVAGFLARARAWAAVVGTGLAGALSLVGLGWVGWALLGGFFAPLGLVAAGASLLAAVLAPLCIVPCHRYSAARAQLYEG